MFVQLEQVNNPWKQNQFLMLFWPDIPYASTEIKG